MAGIGFSLRRLMAPGTYSAYAKAYVYAALVGTGPWLLSVVCLALLGAFAVDPDDFATRQIFASTVVYVFGGTLVITGPLQMVVTRYLADLHYTGDTTRIGETFLPVLCITGGLVALCAVPFFGLADVSVLYRLGAIALAVIIGCTWQVMVFLTTGGHYRVVVAVFAVGTVVSTVASIFGGERWGLEGYLLGYTLGQAVICVALVRHVLSRFGYPQRPDFGFLGHCQRYPALLALGFTYNLAIWVDKFMFWGADLPEAFMNNTIAGHLATAPAYDSSMFMGFLTVIPALAHFLLVVETELAERFHQYYDAVCFKHPLEEIEAARQALTRQVALAFGGILKVQALFTGLCLCLAEPILKIFEMPYSQVALFRYACFGALLLSFIMFTIVTLLYMDRRRDALMLAVLFLSTNVIFTGATLYTGFAYYGIGFAGSALITLAVGLAILFRRLEDLSFITFAGTPLNGQRRLKRGHLARQDGGVGRYHPIHRRQEGA
ncbi:MAG: exopolysaccharide Pel transporter PelG [Bradymonadia bacterium]